MPITYPSFLLEVTAVYGSQDHQPFLNIFYLLGDAAPSGQPWDVPAGALAVIDGAYTTLYQACMTNECTFYGYTAAYHSAGGVTYTGSRATPATMGTLTGETEPDFTAVCIRKQTAINGKSGRGRWFIGCVPEQFTDTSRLNSMALAAYGALKDEFFMDQTILGATFSPQLLSRKTNSFIDIDVLDIDVNLATQRRRRVRRVV